MSDGNLIELNTPSGDILNGLLKAWAQKRLMNAVEAELAELLEQFRSERVDGKQTIVRNGYLPERSIQTGLGDIQSKYRRCVTVQARALGSTPGWMTAGRQLRRNDQRRRTC